MWKINVELRRRRGDCARDRERGGDKLDRGAKMGLIRGVKARGGGGFGWCGGAGGMEDRGRSVELGRGLRLLYKIYIFNMIILLHLLTKISN